MSNIGFTWGGAPNCVLACLVKMEFVRGGSILYIELSEQVNVIIWLWGLTRNCQYASQSIFDNFVIASLWIFIFSFQFLSKSFKSGSDFGSPLFIKLVVWKVWLTAFIIFFATPAALSTTNSGCLIHASQSVNNMSLCVSSISGRLALLPSLDSCYSIYS